MDQPSQPDDVTQGLPPAAPPPAYPPPPAADSPYPPPAPPYPPVGQAPPRWAVPPEEAGPAPGLRFAPHGARLLAYIVDVILVSILVTAVAIVLSFLAAALAIAGAEGLAVLTGVVIALAILIATLGYFPWFWVKGGATPGMRMFKLRVVRDRDGGPLGWGEALLRLFGFWVSSLVFYLGFAWVFVDRRRRGWHDLLAGTVMVQPA